MTDEGMPSIAIFYGSSTGNTQEAAEKIQQELGDFVSHVADVVDSDPEELINTDLHKTEDHSHDNIYIQTYIKN